jgi:ERCC4-type nuclease
VNQVNNSPVRIVADDRENVGGVIDVLRGRDDVLLEVRRLGVGDFWVEENFVIERKTLRDFANSIIDARLFKQAARIAAGARRGVIVLEGAVTTAGDLGVPREALQGALITVSVFYGLAVLRAGDANETARLLIYLGRQAKRFANGALPRRGYRPKGKRARQLFLLQGLPGVGPERAEKMLEHFGSVQGVVASSAEDLATIDGIGEATAARIRWALGESAELYQI